MKPTRLSETSEPRGALRYLIVIFFFLVVAAAWYRFLVQTGKGAFVDAEVYAQAITSWSAGHDPYVLGQGLPFVYPPIFLRVITPIYRLLPAHVGWYGYLGLQAVCLLTVPWTMATAYLRSRWLTPAVAMLVFSLQPNLFEEWVLVTGNVANLFYPLALLAGVRGLRHNRWLPFYLVVAIAGVIKPTFLALLLLPVLAGKRQWVRGAWCVTGVAAIYLAQRIFMPQQYAAFQRNVFSEIVVRGDAGFNLFNYLHQQGRHLAALRDPSVLSALHLLVIGPLLLAFFLLRKRRFNPSVAALWVPALLVLAILANPRMQHIDAEVAVLPALYLWITCIGRSAGAPSIAVVAVCLTLFETLTGKQLEMGMDFLFYTSLLLTLYALIRTPGTCRSEDATLSSARLAVEFS